VRPVRQFIRVVALAIVALVLFAGAAHASAAPTIGAAPSPTGKGYWTVQSDGTVSGFGDAHAAGNAAATDVVGIARTKTGKGYWLATATGRVFSFGDAHSHGAVTARLKKPIVGIAATPTSNGYWLVASDGGVFAFGDAPYKGSTGAIRLKQPIVGMASTPTGHGYWLAASDGGVFTFGDARFYGSTGALHLKQPVRGMAATHTGKGYRLVASDGGVFDFGDATFHGSMGGRHLNAPIAQLAPTPDDKGYWEFAVDGGVFTFGTAPFWGAKLHPVGAVERAFVFPFADWRVTVPASGWKPDQGVDIFLQGRGTPYCGSISAPARRDGPVEVAVAAGTIVGAGISGFGPTAPILHVERGPLTGMYVYYGHSSGNLVGVGVHVVQGQPITHAGCGIVGLSDEPHLEIGMSATYPGVPPCTSRPCHSSATSGAMLSWLLASYGH
jgi:hypothetical protein